jgi:acyl-CoA thioesterase-2
VPLSELCQGTRFSRSRVRCEPFGLLERWLLCDRLGVLPTFDLLDLQPTDDPLQFRLHARKELCTPFGFLYGGSGIAASIEAAERASGRPLQWITTQFIGTPLPDDIVDLRVELPAHGNATTQAQVFGSVTNDNGDTRPVFTSLAAHTSRPSGDGVGFLQMPDVPAPHECTSMSEPFAASVAGSFFDHLDRRIAAGQLGLDAIDNPQRGSLGLWCRIPNHEIGSAATQGFVADIIPLAVCAALGVAPGGTSLDNTVRIVDPIPSEWVLLDITAEGFHRSIGHGSLRIWSQDGRLLGVGQQTCIIRTSHHARI